MASREVHCIIQGGRDLPRHSPVKLALSIVTRDDPEGDNFGRKVTPWTEMEGEGKVQLNRQAIFPLHQKHSSDPQFIDSATLKVEILAAAHPTIGLG
eukprot:CAMPEP_0204337214 /NCGR_PEP_ID=MMETSP0469-20131031/20140_1 /ASSEMBLY_ACC=CAM_ASM_000384 /TAXON_ID=2969 /ORGANISM="Oxyrrhis marina" /LENGTH=96 /DNA_ID=CAMNT_0051321207 /DNA_START=28 /DNA_END=315 /DNA_ORIENTATION=-